MNDIVKFNNIFELTMSEKKQVVENFHNLENIKFSPALPKAFN